MDTGKHNPHVCLVDSELKCTLQTSKVTTGDSTPISGADFAGHFTAARCVEDVRRDNVKLLPERAADDHVEHEPSNEGIYEDDSMLEDESSSEYSYSTQTHNYVRPLVRKALEGYEQIRLKCLIDERCKIMVLDLFKKAHDPAKRNNHARVFEVLEYGALNLFFTGGHGELLYDKMQKLAYSKDFTQGLVHHIIKSSTLTVPVTRLVKQQAGKYVPSEAKFRQDMNQKYPSRRK